MDELSYYCLCRAVRGSYLMLVILPIRFNSISTYTANL